MWGLMSHYLSYNPLKYGAKILWIDKDITFSVGLYFFLPHPVYMLQAIVKTRHFTKWLNFSGNLQNAWFGQSFCKMPKNSSHFVKCLDFLQFYLTDCLKFSKSFANFRHYLKWLLNDRSLSIIILLDSAINGHRCHRPPLFTTFKWIFQVCTLPMS